MAIGIYEPEIVFETPEIQPTYKGLGQTMPKHRLRRMAMDIADHYGIPRDMFMGLVRAESSWNPAAKNPKSSASGLGQIIDGTARMLGLNVTGDENDDRWHPGLNMDASARYLVDLKRRHGSWQKALWYYGERTDAYMDRIRNAADQEINEPLPLPEGWGKWITSGTKAGFSQFVHKISNIPHLLNILRLAGGPEFGAPPLEIQRFGAEVGIDYEHPFEQASRQLKERALEIAPGPEEAATSLPGHVVTALAAAPGAIAGYVPFITLLGPIGGFAAADALSE
jgi:hypothetical protein